MKKRIPYIVAFAWMMAVAVLAFADGLAWSRERTRSAYLDGCAEGDRIYLVENMERDGILYVMDSDGTVKEVSLASAVEKGSFFAKIDYEDALYGLMVKKADSEDTAMRYRIVQFDARGQATVKTPEFTLQQEGVLTGFHAEPKGFYLTAVLENQASAASYFVEKKELGSEETPLIKKPVRMGYSPSGRILVEARYENGDFLFHLDDGSGAEAFQEGEKLQGAFWYRSLSFGQIMRVRRDRMLLYGALLIGGYGVLWLFLSVLRNRSHTVYAIAVVELALLVITLAGAVQVPRIQEKAREAEAERFGRYYVRALAEEMGDPARFHPEEKGFYEGADYQALQEQLSRFVRHDDLSRLFVDICLVRSSDHRILVSVSGRNGQIFEEVYGVGTGKLIQDLADKGREGSMLIGIGGESHQVIATAASEALYPEYVLTGITRREDAAGNAVKSRISPLLYSACVFLAGSVISIWLLLLQGRELKRLARAMQMLAGGETQIRKETVRGKDVDFMWNSLMEIRKTISRINYTKYQIFESCYRFAPKNIEKILGRDSITEVNSGDRVLLHGTMAVVSIAGGQDRENGLAEEISSFVSLIEEHQERSGGFFVSGHCGLDMMKVLFLEESRDTAAFGVSLMQDFARQDTSCPGSRKAGILLHYSQYTYGIAGTGKHSLPYLLSGEMEELERYAGWFRSLNLPLVITETVKNRENLESPVRYLGYLLISDVNERIRLYEVLDACPLREGKLKAQTDPKFQKGIELFYQHDFYLARNTFNEVLRENPEDSMATWYLFTCEKYLNEIHVKGDVCRLCPEISGGESAGRII
ncbi:MAG: hypothetical protein HFH85_04215 [Lachnospiraceae bacterium]|jgi:hypothetical protein|nr:hypothetical protein [Lachnospiraceae bacterium]